MFDSSQRLTPLRQRFIVSVKTVLYFSFSIHLSVSSVKYSSLRSSRVIGTSWNGRDCCTFTKIHFFLILCKELKKVSHPCYIWPRDCVLTSWMGLQVDDSRLIPSLALKSRPWVILPSHFLICWQRVKNYEFLGEVELEEALDPRSL